PIELSVRKRYRKYARSALKDLKVEYSNEPKKYLSEWVQLYRYLIERHHITGMRTFSETSFQVLFSIPGVEMFIVRRDREIIGADIWLVDGEVGYAHLSAISPFGYELRASYALYWVAMQHYARSLRWLDHGAGTGLTQKEDGLTTFKQGWANETRPVYFCGKVLNQKKYEEISRAKGFSGVTYFPAYRDGEYG
ncbi:GNAT family N-acetyltransferase, partial [Chloroflexota bacterium]